MLKNKSYVALLMGGGNANSLSITTPTLYTPAHYILCVMYYHYVLLLLSLSTLL